MTFPAGGAPAAPAGGQSGPATPTPESAEPKTPAVSGEGDASAPPASDKPGADGGAAAPDVPQIEKPRNFREALDRARTAPESGGEGEAPKDPAKKVEPKAAEPKTDAGGDAAEPRTPEKQPDPKKAEAAETDKPEPKKEAPAPDPAAAEPKKAEKAAPPPAAAESDDDGDDDELLGLAEDRDAFNKKFEGASKSAMDFAFRQARKNAALAPIAQLVESVGGPEGAKLAFDYTNALTEFSRPAASAEDLFKQANSFREFLWKNAPGAAGKFESAVFWKAVEDTPEGHANVNGLLDERYGDGVLTVQQMDVLANAFADGQIDIDDLMERADYSKTKAQREAEARSAQKESKEVRALREELEQIKGQVNPAETAEAKEETRKLKVQTAFQNFHSTNEKLVEPILREYGFALPEDENSPEYKEKSWYRRHVLSDVTTKLANDPDFQAVLQNLNNLQTEGVHSILEGTVRNKMRVALRQVLDEVAPGAAAEINRKNKLVADRVKQRGKTTTTAPAKSAAGAPPRDDSNSGRAMSGEERRLGLARMIESGRHAADE